VQLAAVCAQLVVRSVIYASKHNPHHLSSRAVLAEPAGNIDDLPDGILLFHVISKVGVSDRGVLTYVYCRKRVLVKRGAGVEDLLRVSNFISSVSWLYLARKNTMVSLG